MKITSMTVENFLSFGKAGFDLSKQGLVLVEGDNRDDESARSNGSGKSAMIDALVWCLFGTTLRGYENDEVIHRKVGDGCLVTVSLEQDDHHWVITRARRHSKHKNTLRVLTPDADLSKPSNAETQEVVDQVIGCSRRTFLSSVVFGQDRAYRFSSLTDKDQKEILDEVLGVERFARACNAARASAAVIETRRGIIGHDLEKLDGIIEDVERELEDMQQKDADFARSHEEKLRIEREKLDKARAWVKKNDKVDLDKLKTDLSRRSKEVEAAEKASARSTTAGTAARIAQAQAESRVGELQRHLERHEKLAGECPTCGQEVDKKKRSAVVADVRKQLVVAVKLHREATAVVEAEDERAGEVRARLKEAGAALLVAQKAHNEGVGAAADAKAWQQRVADHEARIAELSKEANPYSGLTERLQKRLGKHRKETELLRSQLASEDIQLKLAEFWVKAFGAKGLRSLLLDSSLPLLNEEAAKVSRAVSGGSISIDFSATSELKSGKTTDRFEVRVDNKHGAGSYLGNSAGERAKVDLCVGLALQKLVASRSSASFNLCFFDEIFDHLDSAAHERVVDVLSEIDKESVFVVSHNDDLKAWFPATLCIVKKDGFSEVER